MIFHFRRLEAQNGYLVSLEDYLGLEISVLLDDGYRNFVQYPWDISVAYEREV